MVHFQRGNHILAIYAWKNSNGDKLLELQAGQKVEFMFLGLKKQLEDQQKGTFPFQGFFNKTSSVRVLGMCIFCLKTFNSNIKQMMAMGSSIQGLPVVLPIPLLTIQFFLAKPS